MTNIRKYFAWILLPVLLAMAWLAYYAFHQLALPATPFEFELKKGGNLKGMTHELRQAGLIEQEWAFIWLARILGKSGHIQAGYYVLDHPVTPLKLLDMLDKGAVIQRKLSIIEGWTFRQFRDALNGNPDLKHVTVNMTDAEILQQIGAAEHYPEGLFFPDTYHFAAGTRDIAIIKRAYQTMQQRLYSAWSTRDANLPLQTPYEALILASIVEKETGIPADRAMIAGVFVNRLRKGMMLQTDPAVIYGLGNKFDGNLRKRDLLSDTAYNTYTRRGLTPTPIALPGMAAIQATLHPAPTDALYFVSRGDGSSQFSSSLKQHNQAVTQYQLKRK